MTFSTDEILNKIDEKIDSHHLLKHPFYQAWSRGELTIECLKEYAKEYYHHVSAFPTYLSAIHCRTEDAETRGILLQNLIEEEAGSPNHPQLWKQFALSLGVTEDELSAHHPSFAMQDLISTFRTICHEKPTTAAVGALYAYESQIPSICISKIDGLKQHYGMKNPADWRYFSVHIAADEEHSNQERAIMKHGINATVCEDLYSSVDSVLKVLWNFLSALCDRYHIEACHSN